MKYPWLLMLALAVGGISAGCSTYEGDDDSSDEPSTHTPSPDADEDGFDAGQDCNDNDASIYPGAAEVCADGVDNDCDSGVDESTDNDKDGVFSCPTDGSSADCDDGDAATHPGASELCDGKDNDCDGSFDENFDADLDGVTTCASTPDCNDNDAAIYPGVEETCDGVDNDCSGKADEAFDVDGDGVTTCAATPDCDDSDKSIYPGAAEVCDNVDNNCSGGIDENFDVDKDGFTTCSAERDCDDNDAARYPGAIDICDNEVDENCDGQLGTSSDLDKDGYVNCGDAAELDCDDSNKFNNPSPETLEQCDTVDNNCDGVIDEGVSADTQEPNDDEAHAFDLGVIDAAQKKTLTGSISLPTDEDWYMFESIDQVDDFWRVIVNLKDIPEGADYDVYLYKADSGNLIMASQNSGDADETINFQGLPGGEDGGIYYVRVAWKTGVYGCPAYTLEISAG